MFSESFQIPPHLRLGNLRHWSVNLTPRGNNGLPYSKIKAHCNTYRQRLVASRKARAPITRTTLPTAISFICQPTPSYVLSPQLASRLSGAEFSSLTSKLRVYETVFTGKSGVGEISRVVEEQDCTPEVIVEPGLKGDDQALYYGHGQVHVVGMLDMHSAEVKDNVRFSSAADLERLLALEFVEDLGHNAWHDPVPYIHCSTTDEGWRQLARVSADVDYTEDIVTASITLNLAVPMPGLDPDRTCTYNRLAAIGVEYPSASIWTLKGMPASDQGQEDGNLGDHQMHTLGLAWAVQRALGNGELRMPLFADHSRALGASDPDLETDKGEGPLWV